jgi:hypothetical protein
MVAEPMVLEAVVSEPMVVKPVMPETMALDEWPRVPRVAVSEPVMLEAMVPEAPMVSMREGRGWSDQGKAQQDQRDRSPSSSSASHRG